MLKFVKNKNDLLIYYDVGMNSYNIMHITYLILVIHITDHSIS